MLPECVSSQCQEMSRNRTDVKAWFVLSHNLGNRILLNFDSSHLRNLKAAVCFCPMQFWILQER